MSRLACIFFFFVYVFDRLSYGWFVHIPIYVMLLLHATYSLSSPVDVSILTLCGVSLCTKFLS